MKDLLMERWNSEYVTGDIQAPVPSLLAFKNIDKAVELLHKHIKMKSRIVVHCDVDMDGIGCGYILKPFLRSQGVNKPIFIINKEKEHGIKEKHVDYFDRNPIDLLIIVDSSSNEIETIKKFNCDVLVIDHHEISHDETYINGEHEYIIVNNMIDNLEVEGINEWLCKGDKRTEDKLEPYEAEERMSGGQVLYETLRVYCEYYKTGNVLSNLMLYQWVGITLFSDAILLAPDRNQWYVANTVNSMETESCLGIMLEELNKYRTRLDKSFISFTLVPTINKAIRAGASGEVLDIILNRPKCILELDKYKEEQANAVEKAANKDMVYRQGYIMKDISNLNISKNYCGVIASRLCGDNNKNTVVFIRDGDMIAGSFRGRMSNVDYRQFFEDYDETIFAQGHKAAFGFKGTVDQITEIMKNIDSIEPDKENFYLTAGKLDDEFKGKYHIDDIMEFKKQGYFWRLAIANSRLSSQEQLEIIISSRDVTLKEQKGKLYVYEVFGMECKAFEIINTKLVTMYVENITSVEVYIRNYTIK